MSIYHRFFEGEELVGALPSVRLREAYDIWSDVKSETGFIPRLCDMNFMLDKDAMDWAGIALRLPNGDFEFVHFGKNVQSTTNVPFLGRAISELSPNLRAVYRDVLERVVNNTAPLYTVHAAQASTTVTMWGRLMVPVRGAGGADYVLICFEPHDLAVLLKDMAFDALSEGVVGLNPVFSDDRCFLDAHILFGNRVFCQLFNLHEQELKGQSLRKIMDETLGFEAFLILADAYDAHQNTEFTSTNAYGVPYQLKMTLASMGFVLSVRGAA